MVTPSPTAVMPGPGTYAYNGYRASRVASKEGRTPPTGGAAAHELVDRRDLIRQSRDFRRNNPIYQGMIVRPRQFIVGTGFKLQLLPSVPPGQKLSKRAAKAVLEWCKQTEQNWNAWWECPDVRGILSGPRMEALVMDELLTCGDTGVILVDKEGLFGLQAIEAEQIESKTRRGDGVERDALGRPIKFTVMPYSEAGQLDSNRSKDYSPEEFLFVCDQPERASSLRGVPPLQSGFPNLHRLSDIADSEAIAWQTQSRVALQINRKDGAPVASSVSKADPSVTDTEGKIEQGRVTDLGYAILFHGAIGEEIKGVERTAPNRSFREVFRALLQLNGLPMSLPIEFILLDFTADNYSQTRALVAMFCEWILERQLGLASQFHNPVFRWWLKKQPPCPGTFKHQWIKPVFPGIDLEAETRAWSELMRHGLRSYSEAVKAQNNDPDEVKDQIEADVRNAIERSKQIETDTGVAVPYGTFCGQPGPALVKPPAPAQAKPEGKPKDGSKPPAPDKPEPADEEEVPE